MIESLSFYCKVLERNETSQNQDLVLQISKGETCMAMEVYKFLAKKLFWSSNKDHILRKCSTFIFASYFGVYLFVLLLFSVILTSNMYIFNKEA